MALAHVANRGALSAKAAGAALDLVLAAGQDIGLDRLVLVWAAWDNSDNVDAATTRLSASDEVGNTYTPIVEFTQGGGGAAAGVTAFLAAAVTSTAPAEGDFIRVTSTDGVRVAKVLSVAEFSKAAGSTIAVADSDAAGGTGGGAFAPTLADLEEREYLLAGGFVFERGDHASLAFDQDDDYTSIGFASTVGGAANSNLSLFGGFRIATVTGDTWGVSVGSAAGECAHFLAAFYEEEGDETVEGDVANVLPGLAQAAVVVVTVAGAAAGVLPGLVAAATGEATVSGEAAQTLPALAQSADGALTVEGVAAQTLPALEQAAEGTVEVSGVAGSIANDLPALEQSASGALSVSGAAASTLPGLTQDAQGALTVRGEAAGMLGQLVAAAGGTLTVHGEGGSILPALQTALTGEIPVSGQIAAVLPALVAELEGQLLGLAGPAVTERTRVTLGGSSASAGVLASATSVELDTGETFA